MISDPFDSDPSFRALFDWCLSDDPLEGEWWDIMCEQQGVDPEKFAELVTDMRRRLTAEDRDKIHHAVKVMYRNMRQRRFKAKRKAAAA